MSETLEERLRREAKYDYADNCLIRVYYASEVVGLLDARDKIIAEQHAAIAELSNEPITEFETLRQAHDAQNAVLHRKDAELVSLRAWRDAATKTHDKLIQFSTDCLVIILDMKTDLARMQQRVRMYRRIIAGLCKRLRFFRVVSDIKRRNTW